MNITSAERTDEDAVRSAFTIDPTRSTIIMLFGMKGRGKSAAARTIFDAWPADRTVIDPTGNARPDDPATIAFAPPFPSALPEGVYNEEGLLERVTVWARINPGSPTLAFDQDQAMGMAMNPRHRTKLIWRDEFGLGTSPHQTLPNDRTLLMSSRHWNASALLVVQRPLNIPKLAIQQSDRIFVWRLPDPGDREYVARNSGIDVPLFEREYQDNQKRGRHAFLLIDRENDVLLNCPPLPGITARGPKS